MSGMDMKISYETRRCEVNGEVGYFHLWEQWSNVVGESLVRGGHPGGQVGQVYGIVEFAAGVRRVDPTDIHFCDEEHQILVRWPKKGESNAED